MNEEARHHALMLIDKSNFFGEFEGLSIDMTSESGRMVISAIAASDYGDREFATLRVHIHYDEVQDYKNLWFLRWMKDIFMDCIEDGFEKCTWSIVPKVDTYEITLELKSTLRSRQLTAEDKAMSDCIDKIRRTLHGEVNDGSVETIQSGFSACPRRMLKVAAFTELPRVKWDCPIEENESHEGEKND